MGAKLWQGRQESKRGRGLWVEGSGGGGGYVDCLLCSFNLPIDATECRPICACFVCVGWAGGRGREDYRSIPALLAQLPPVSLSSNEFIRN